MPSYAISVTDANGESRAFDVSFPFTAYECQVVFMERALAAMVRGESALLESPTGTGKTLCLLAATLAFVREEKRRGSRQKVDGRTDGASGVAGALDATAAAMVEAASAGASRAPVIIYATRTHSQVDQVIRELKLLDGAAKSTVLASRQHLCAHKSVRELKGAEQNQACSNLVRNHGCGHRTELERLWRDPSKSFWSDGVQDIEDLVGRGIGTGSKSRGPCPFYLSRFKCGEAEIILMPYNYLLDESVQLGLEIKWKDAVIVVDEAHNLESSAADSMSYTLTAGKLAKAIDEARRAYETKLTMDDTSMDGIVSEEEKKAMMLGFDPEEMAMKAADFQTLAGVLVQLETRIDEECRAAPKPSGGDPSSQHGERVEDGQFIYKIFNDLNVNVNTYQTFVTMMKCAAKTVVRGSEIMSQPKQRETPLMEIAKFVERIFKKKQPQFFVTRVGPDTDTFRSGRKKAGPSLSYWCFFPGLCLQSLTEKGVGSFLLASGTLSPMDSFAHELALDFPVRLENPHVIQSNQVWGGVVTRGPNGNVQLNSSFRLRDTPEYKSEIGNVVLSAAKIIPDGLLVFFPSYGVMNSCIQHWKATGIWAGLDAVKTCVVEPSNSEEFHACYKEFNVALQQGTKRGAAFFAVCRGKVSEGIDFADKACRGVILTGIPYAGSKDPLVHQKRLYLDKRKQKNGDGYSGNEWYSQTAMRAVNQALGRVIRNRYDFGAVILADERFANENARNQISLWLRPSIQVHSTFRTAAQGLREFFNLHAGRSDEVAAKRKLESGAVLAKMVDVVPVKQMGEKKQKQDRKKSITSLIRQFSAQQDGEGAKASTSEGDAAQKFMLVSKQSVPSRGIDGFAARDARSKYKAATAKSSLLSQLATSRTVTTTTSTVTATAAGDSADADQNAAPSVHRTKLFMRRARAELTREAYDELTAEIEKVKNEDFDIGNVLRVASRVLKAPENPKGLYALFGEFVPRDHKSVYEEHRRALIERQNKLKASRPSTGVGADGTARSPVKTLPVVNPPSPCVACGAPCNKPFQASACAHVACYACWLARVKPKGPGTCPSCGVDVLKRHLVKKFF